MPTRLLKKQEKPERKWEISRYIEDNSYPDGLRPLYSSHPRSCKIQCKCDVWAQDQKQLDDHIDDHIMRKFDEIQNKLHKL